MIAEPRLTLQQSGPLKVLEAFDDRDQSLLIEPADPLGTQRLSGYFGVYGGTMLQLQVPLKHPDQAGTTIQRLRGVVPVLVSTRKLDPLVVPLQNAAGKSFKNDELILSIQNVSTAGSGNQTTIQMSLQIQGSDPLGNLPGAIPGGFEPAGLPMRNILYQQARQHQIEVVDAQGRLLPHSFSGGPDMTRLTLMISHLNQGIRPRSDTTD